jgi:hypothetical protein
MPRIKEIKTMTGKQVAALLNIHSPKKLKKLRDEAAFSFFEISPHNIIYDADSVYKYLEGRRIV